jgi:hypothetical protein
MPGPTCSLCQLPGATLQAGGDLGLVHPSCFDTFDRQEEAMELMGVAQGHSWDLLPVEPRWYRSVARGEACHA